MFAVKLTISYHVLHTVSGVNPEVIEGSPSSLAEIGKYTFFDEAMPLLCILMFLWPCASQNTKRALEKEEESQ